MLPLLLYVLAAIALGYAGRHRRIGFLGFFLASLLLTPIVTLLVLVLTAPKKDHPVAMRAPRS